MKGGNMTKPVIEISTLSLALPGGADRLLAVDDVSFSVNPGEILCVVGESGSGKSMLANAVMGLLPPVIRVTGGRVLFEDRDLLELSEEELRALRGQKIGMIFQEPMTALNPLMRVGDQIAEVFESHGLLTPGKRQERAVELLSEVGLPDPSKAVRAYPFQLSGGQRQRVMIAMALALDPKLLIADEPTTALDVTTQAQILQLIRELQKKHGTAVMFITHDFGVVAEIADRVCVMQTGKIVEIGSARDVLSTPAHPYTKSLIAAIPKPRGDGAAAASAAAPILSVRNLTKTYRSGGGWFREARVVPAVDGISFDLARGETLGIVGESGSGKSSLGRCLVRLIKADSGSVQLGDVDMLALSPSELLDQRRRMQMVFQDPYGSLNPRTRVDQIIAEGSIAGGMAKEEALSQSRDLLKLVGLESSAGSRYPHEFSGGQRQRIGIARALALEPEVIIADESVSALDVSIQAQVLSLLDDLKRKLDLALLFITHDLLVAAQICDRIAVMQHGKIVEIGDVASVFGNPQSDYTRQLLDAIPGMGPDSPLAGNFMTAARQGPEG
jgi:peptide/nickel transport system ATP-binding protein